MPSSPCLFVVCPHHPGRQCFQAHALPFEGETQWLQFGDGMDSSNRKEIPAVDVSNGTLPKGSSWRRNPIPACKGGADAISLGAFNSPCKEPQFTPPVPGAFGFGGGSCGSGKAQCTPKQFKDHSFDFGVVDKLRVPATLPAGDYVLSFRWVSALHWSRQRWLRTRSDT